MTLGKPHNDRVPVHTLATAEALADPVPLAEAWAMAWMGRKTEIICSVAGFWMPRRLR